MKSKSEFNINIFSIKKKPIYLLKIHKVTKIKSFIFFYIP